RGERRCEPVHVVEQIECVRHPDEPEHAEDRGRDVVTYDLDPYAGREHERRGAELRGDLRERRQTGDVVPEAGEVEDDAAAENAVAVALLEILRCPFCRSSLREEGDGLACGGCGRRFDRASGGIPLMLHQELPGAREKLREAEGWLEKARAEGWYEPDDAVDA